MDKDKDEILEALQELYNEQNGPPLIRREIDWNRAMRKAEEVLKKYGGKE